MSESRKVVLKWETLMKLTQAPMCLLLLLLSKCISLPNALTSWGKLQNFCTEAKVSIRILPLMWNLIYAYFIKKCLKSAHSAVIAREMGWCSSGQLPGFVLGLSWKHKSLHCEPWLLFNRQTPYALWTEHKGAGNTIPSNCFLCDTDRLQQNSNRTPMKTPQCQILKNCWYLTPLPEKAFFFLFCHPFRVASGLIIQYEF